MSLLKKIGKAVKKVAKPVISAVKPALMTSPLGRVVTAGASVLGAAGGGYSSAAVIPGAGAIMGALPQIGRSLPAIGGAVRRIPQMASGLPRWSRQAAKAAGYTVVGGLVYDAVGNLIGAASKSRRINPLNSRALNRAMRRVCAAKKVCERVSNITAGKPARRKRAC
jgi:hypothetical protein